MLALIAGPTASGKSALALDLAEQRNGVVINADASQVYRDLRILTARPTVADEARVPHALYGYVAADGARSAASWAIDATRAIEAAWAAGRLPILVGGTGLYIRTLLDGIAPVPDIDPAVRAEVRAQSVAENHRALQKLDPHAAATLHANDTTRIARALEVARSTGRPLRDWQAQREGGIGDRVRLAPLILLPDRAELITRCDARVAVMFEEGAVDEVRALLDLSPPADAPVRRAIGVREIAALLAGTMSREEATDGIRTATRQYAKRQYTWFGNQPPTDWHRISYATIDYFEQLL